MIEIKKLDYELMEGKTYSTEIHSDEYLSIEPEGEGFRIEWVKSEQPLNMTLEDDILSEWLEEPSAFGAYEGDKLLGFVEGFLEKWNNRYRITNICVFDTMNRRAGIGQMLINQIIDAARKSGARMMVLETQSYNSRAIAFYKKNGFEIIGFDRYAYSNNGPEERNMRIEMGRSLTRNKE